METTILMPKVDKTQEFIEIASDFTNPLDLVREAISNAFDAKAKHIAIEFSVVNIYGNSVLVIKIHDDGEGMDIDKLQNFFDLGNSSRRGDNDEHFIGEKGHGTKIYFNSANINVETIKDGKKYIAFMDKPLEHLYNRNIPEVKVTMEDDKGSTYTEIIIQGYNNNRRDKFTHAQIVDYIIWFTKMGSIEKEFNIKQYADVELKVKGIDREEFETISFGHYFPDNSKSCEDLFDEYITDAPDWYCRKKIKSGTLKNSPENKYDAIFCVEGSRVKYSYNKMLKHRGYTAPSGAYTISDRYGLWLCKDYIPVQRVNDWITSKGSEYTRFHAFINCQALKLTANRGSIENTPSEILIDLKEAAQSIYNEITQGEDWSSLAFLESEASGYRTSEAESNDYGRRVDRANTTRIADYKGLRLVEPKQESGVYALFLQIKGLAKIEKNLNISNTKDIFPFTVIDYDTHMGYDVLVKTTNEIPIKKDTLEFIEFKHYLGTSFNHSFKYLRGIVCWDIDTNKAKNGTEFTDVSGAIRILQIVPPAKEGDYTRYYLDAIRSAKKIEIYVLKEYLNECLGITFRPRTELEIE